MAEEYSKSLLRVSLAQICQNVGFHGITSTAFDVLLDLLRHHIENLCENARIYSDHCGRAEPILDDVGLVFTQLGVSLNELSDYVNQTTPITFVKKVPKYPIKRPHKLNIPSSDCAELKTRPDYVPYYLPPMQPEIVEEQNSLESEIAKTNAARVSTRRSTLQQKSDQYSGEDWLSDLYDFDSVKAGLVKIVHIPTPIPSAQPSPQPATPAVHYPAIPKITIVEIPPIESITHKQSSTYHNKTSSSVHTKQTKSHTSSKLFEEKLTISKSVLKDLNVSISSTSDHSADTSIEEIISSVVEQSHHLKAIDQQYQQQISPQISDSGVVKIPKSQISPAVTADTQQKLTKSLSLKLTIAQSDLTTTKTMSKTISDLQVVHPKHVPTTSMDEPKFPHVVVNAPLVTLSSTTSMDKPPVLKPAVFSTQDDDQKRIKKRAEEKEAKKRKIEGLVSQLTPVVKRAPPPMPIVDTSNLFKPDAKIISTSTSTVKKVAPIALPKQKPIIEPIVAAPIAVPSTSSVLPDSLLKQSQPSATSRPKTPTTKLGPLKIIIKPSTLSSSAAKKLKIQEKARKKEKLKEKKVKEKLLTTKKAEKVSDLMKKLPKKIHLPLSIPTPKLPAENSSAMDVSDILKVPKLILKIKAKSSEQDKLADEPKKLTSHVPGRPLFTISPNRSSPDRENSSNIWANDDDVKDSSRSGELNLSDLRLSPPPKSPSMHSKSPSLQSFSCANDDNANSPPPPTPSPRSPSPGSPIGIYIPEADAEDFGKEMESPVGKLESPARSHVSVASTAKSHVSTASKTSTTSKASTSTAPKKFIQEQQPPTLAQVDEEKVWYCPVCRIPYEEGADMIACDKCDNWFHWSCVGLAQAPPDDEPWYCTTCAYNNKRPPKINKIIVKQKKSKKTGK